MPEPSIYSYLTLVGTISVSENGEGFIDGIYLPNCNLPSMRNHETDALAEAGAQINEYIAGKRDFFELSYSYSSTEFGTKVLDAIFEIPYGETRTYREIAEEVGSPNAYRRVGTVCAQNSIPLIIPCHRVVPASGGYGGYIGGTALKKYFIELERSMM